MKKSISQKNGKLNCDAAGQFTEVLPDPYDLGVDTDEWEIGGSGRIYFGMGGSF